MKNTMSCKYWECVQARKDHDRLIVELAEHDARWEAKVGIVLERNAELRTENRALSGNLGYVLKVAQEEVECLEHEKALLIAALEKEYRVQPMYDGETAEQYVAKCSICDTDKPFALVKWSFPSGKYVCLICSILHPEVEDKAKG